MQASSRCAPVEGIRRRAVVCAVLALAAVGWLWGSGPAMAQAASPNSLLPPEIRQAGVLKAGMPLDFAPYNYIDAKNQVVGLDVDIFHAIAAVLKVKPEIERLAFASLIPSVSGGRVDVAMAIMAIIPARLKQVSFVRYGMLANALIVKAGNPSGIGNNDACGHAIAVEQGTQPVDVWTAVSKQCVKDGKQPIKLTMFNGEGPQVLAVETGRADGAGVSYATAMMAPETSNGKLAAAPGGPAKGFTVNAGIAYKSGRDDLGKAIEAALNVIIADGTYKKIFEKWHLGDTTATPAIFK